MIVLLMVLATLTPFIFGFAIAIYLFMTGSTTAGWVVYGVVFLSLLIFYGFIAND